MAPPALTEDELAQPENEDKEVQYRITMLEEQVGAGARARPGAGLRRLGQAGLRAAEAWVARVLRGVGPEGGPGLLEARPNPAPPSACRCLPCPRCAQMAAMEVDLEAIQKWRTKDAEYAERGKELEAATAERDAVSAVQPKCWTGEQGLMPGGQVFGAQRQAGLDERCIGCCPARRRRRPGDAAHAGGGHV